jgi:hypothetical protein
MNINLSNRNVADDTMATMFPRLYMAINIIKLILVIIVLYVLYRLKANEARHTQQRQVLPGQRTGQYMTIAQGFRS